MKRTAKRFFNRKHRDKFGLIALIGFAAEGIQQILPYLPESTPHTAVLVLTAFAFIGAAVAHFVQPEATGA